MISIIFPCIVQGAQFANFDIGLFRRPPCVDHCHMLDSSYERARGIPVT